MILELHYQEYRQYFKTFSYISVLLIKLFRNLYHLKYQTLSLLLILQLILHYCLWFEREYWPHLSFYHRNELHIEHDAFNIYRRQLSILNLLHLQLKLTYPFRLMVDGLNACLIFYLLSIYWFKYPIMQMISLVLLQAFLE